MSNLRNRRGQGLVEYILIVVLMGIFAIGVVRGLSKSTQSGFSDAAQKLQNALDG